MNSAPKTTIELQHPEMHENSVTFRWTVSPPTSLYRKTEFTLNFPAAVDISKVPVEVWWRVGLLCLHSHWMLLGPCTVRLPVRLATGEAEVWQRLNRSYDQTLSAYSKKGDRDASVEIIEDGPPLKPVTIPDSGRYATSFSGGKDSLLQTGLLAELTERPLLVTTTSPMPLLDDHSTERRRHILNEIGNRRDVELVEVTTDYRGNLEHNFASELGYPVSVNEMTDAFLYLASLVAVGAARGVVRLSLASELEVQQNIWRDGRAVQHTHFMYSAATLSALSSIFAKVGMSCFSLTPPLHSYQVQKLLATRYTDLLDLQYSCWRLRMGETACNSCSQCLRLALAMLELGQPPSTIGMRIGRILRTMRKWRPRELTPAQFENALPSDIVSARLHAELLRSVLTIKKSQLVSEINRFPSKRLPPAGRFVSMLTFNRLRRHAKRSNLGPSPGYFPSFLVMIDPRLREDVGRIYSEYFVPVESGIYEDVFNRSRDLSAWITAPLDGVVD